MKISAYFSPVVKILLWTVFGVALFATVLGVVAMCNVPVFNLTPASGLVLVSSMPLISLLCLSFATIHYKLGDTHLCLNVAFWDILGGRISVANILNIVYTDGKMYISYIWKGADPVIAQIAVAPKNFDKMKDALMAKNPRIVFYDDNGKNEEEDN